MERTKFPEGQDSETEGLLTHLAVCLGISQPWTSPSESRSAHVLLTADRWHGLDTLEKAHLIEFPEHTGEETGWGWSQSG